MATEEASACVSNQYICLNSSIILHSLPDSLFVFMFRCDADPAALSKYIVALLRKEKPRSALKELCINQLEVFLSKGIISHVISHVMYIELGTIKLYTKYMYQCVHYIKYTSIYKVHVPMCPLYKVHLYIQSTCTNVSII